MSNLVKINKYNSPTTELDSVIGKYKASFSPTEFSDYASGDIVVPLQCANTAYSADIAIVAWDGGDNIKILADREASYGVKVAIFKKSLL